MFPQGNVNILINEAPEEPFGGGVAGEDFSPSDIGTTGQVMKFKVVPRNGRDTSKAPVKLALPLLPPLGSEVRTRKLSLNEEESETVRFSEDESGNIILDPEGDPFGPTAAKLGILDASGNPVILKWADAVTENPRVGDTEIWETGFKDTVIAYPGQITRIKAFFDIPGRYVWHCHIVDHEDNEMMRPYDVLP